MPHPGAKLTSPDGVEGARKSDKAFRAMRLCSRSPGEGELGISDKWRRHAIRTPGSVVHRQQAEQTVASSGRSREGSWPVAGADPHTELVRGFFRHLRANGTRAVRSVSGRRGGDPRAV